MSVVSEHELGSAAVLCFRDLQTKTAGEFMSQAASKCGSILDLIIDKFMTWFLDYKYQSLNDASYKCGQK